MRLLAKVAEKPGFCCQRLPKRTTWCMKLTLNPHLWKTKCERCGTQQWRFAVLRMVQRILTARAASRAMMVREMIDWSIVANLAQRERTAVSVGEKAVLVLKARNR